MDKALANHAKGYNCSQSVACAYADLVGMDERTMFKLMEGFGLGMGGTYGTCGALTGAMAIVGMRLSGGNLDGPLTKAETYKVAERIIDEFRQMNHSCVCRDLKGIETDSPFKSCDEYIADASAILERTIFAT